MDRMIDIDNCTMIEFPRALQSFGSLGIAVVDPRILG